MPHNLYDEIIAKYNGEQAKRELVSTWLASHPCPTWEHVAELLRNMEEEGWEAAEEVEETYLKSELQYSTEIHVQFNYCAFQSVLT